MESPPKRWEIVSENHRVFSSVVDRLMIEVFQLRIWDKISKQQYDDYFSKLKQMETDVIEIEELVKKHSLNKDR